MMKGIHLLYLLWLCLHQTNAKAPVFQVLVEKEYPHQTDAFTEGLFYDESSGCLFESTGRHSQSSSLRQVNLQNGSIITQYLLNNTYFGEGLTLLNNQFYQLTYQNDVVFVYNQNTFTSGPESWMKNPDEGWGLTHNGTSLIMSDGTSTIKFLDPKDFSLQREINVMDGGKSVQLLNELEYINGEIWANIWFDKFIVTIDPASGTVTSRLNCTGLMPHPPESFNGIAYDRQGDRIFVTGKLWPTLFQIKVLKY